MDGEGWELGLVTEDDFPYGLRCIECGVDMPPGSSYTTRVIEDSYGGREIICPGCSVL